MKELENRDRRLILSRFNAGRKAFIILGFLFFVWGCGLFYILLTGSKVLIPELTGPIYVFAFCLFVGGIKSMLYSNIYVGGNTTFNFYKVLNSDLVRNILPGIFMFNFFLMFLLVGIYAKPVFALFGAVFFFVFILGLIQGAKEYLKKRKIAKPFETSSIEIKPIPLSNIENTFIVAFSNSTPLLDQMLLDFTLRFLKERNVRIPYKNSKKTKSELKTFIHFENKKTVILENGKAIAEFTLPQDESLLNNFDFQKPDYWELEVSEKETGFFSRFVLEGI